ncbi:MULTISPECIES: hypothetical protein [Exiguobacterium]|uniref:hypothetical protein n=1 Tax=Exiguobacterium TaxID=33986 RepID=UPI000685B5C4|nr:MULTISPECIES: hypothetical protein [Exiguobacterium]
MKNYLVFTISMLLLAFIIFLGIGFHKLTVYENPSSDDEYVFTDEEDSVNAYVGGDAYNYMINASQATAYFVLAGFSLLSTICLFILNAIQMNIRNEKSIDKEPEESNDLIVEGT